MDFKDKHPTCGFVNCCVNKRGLETCADCAEFPCKRFDKEGSGLDSFVTHRKVFSNLDFVKLNGIELFMDKQRIRMDILTDLLNRYDDGRSKSFYCLACALLPIGKLNECRICIDSIDNSADVKDKCKKLKECILQIAEDLKIELKLNNKTNTTPNTKASSPKVSAL